MPALSPLLGFFIGAIAFQKSRTDDINALYQDIYECGAFVWLNLAQQEHFTTCSANFG